MTSLLYVLLTAYCLFRLVLHKAVSNSLISYRRSLCFGERGAQFVIIFEERRHALRGGILVLQVYLQGLLGTHLLDYFVAEPESVCTGRIGDDSAKRGALRVESAADFVLAQVAQV